MTTEQDEYDEDADKTLAEIIKRDDDYEATRIATFTPNGDKLIVTEGCDDYFSVELDKVEVRRLRDWLDAWLNATHALN